MTSQTMPAASSLPQDPLLASLVTSTQKKSGDGNISSSDGPFAELLQSLFVQAGSTNGQEPGQATLPSKRNGQAGIVNMLDSKSVPSSDSKAEKGGGQKDVPSYSNVMPLMAGMILPPPAAQVSTVPNNQSTPYSNTLQPAQPKIEQRLVALLTGAENPGGWTSPDSTQSNPTKSDSTSESTDARNDFLAMLSKKASENPAVKENLLQLLSEAPNSSINRDSAADLQKAMAEISSQGTKLSQENGQSNALQNLLSSNSQTLAVTQKSEKAGQTSGKNALAGNKNMQVASIMQSAASSSEPALKPSVVHDDQNAAGAANPSSDSGKAANKIQAVAGKNGSQKSNYDAANLIKQNGADIYQGLSANSKADPRFKQELTNAVDGSHDAASSRPDISQVAQTVIREAKMMTQENKTVVNVKLEPESLGSVTLRVASDNGKLSAEFNVKTADAQAYLETSIPQMRQMLQSNGISLTHLSVSLSGGESQTRQQRSPSRKTSQKSSIDVEADPIDTVRSFGYNTMEVKV